MRIALIAIYEMGRQPFGVASAAAWLGREGHQVSCADLAIEGSPDALLLEAELIAFHLPMHTATRLAVGAIAKARALNKTAAICCFGLYAPINAEYLRSLGVDAILGGEFEDALARLARGETAAPLPLPRLKFQVPDRSSLPPLSAYAKLYTDGVTRIAGYTEASRGCKHRCRHCPVVNVYDGAFRVVQADVVLADIRQQVEAGAEHITFGDPDFWNGPTHAARILERMHRQFPRLTYDATIKIEHLRNHRDLLPSLKETGCLFVTSAVESLDDAVLGLLEKGHTQADFFAVVEDFRRLGMTLAPTFIAFTPWTTLESYRELLDTILRLDLVENVPPVQLALRLLIPSGSRLLELADIQAVADGFDAAALLHRWRHPQPDVDALAAAALRVAARKKSRSELFRDFWQLAAAPPLPENYGLLPRAAVPYLNEPWYC